MNRLHFLDGPALWALALLVIVVVLYILRMPRRRLQIASIAYLRGLQMDARRRRRRLRTVLSMLLQAVVLVLLAFSAARPLLTSGRLEERRIVLIMDVSASMRTQDGGEGMTRFEAARKKAEEIVGRMEHGDRMLIVAADSEARIVQQFERDRHTLYRTLSNLEPGFETTDLSQAFELVREVIRPLAEPQVFLLSDAADELDADRYSEVLSKVQFHAFGQAKGNVGIVSFSARRNMDSERDFSSLIALLNTFDEPRKGLLKLSIGGTTVQIQELTLEPHRLVTEMYEMTLVVGGAFRADLTIVDPGVEDHFPVDNVAHEWIPKRERIKVLVVAPEEDRDGYLDAAMSANIGVQGYRINPGQYHPNYDVGAMIFYNWTPEKLPDAPLIFVNTRGENPAAHVSQDAVLRPLMRSWDRTHPLMNYISLENLLLSTALAVKGEEWMEPVARTVQTPIVLAGRRGAQKLVFVAFDPKQSDFPFRLAFPVLVSNSLLWFTQDEVGEQETQFRPGEVVEIRVPENLRDRPDEVTVTDPFDETAQAKVIGNAATFTQTYLCGTYTYELGKRTHGFAVNLRDAKESDIAPRASFGDSLAKVESLKEEMPVIKFWVILNMLALCLICVEAYVYHQRILF